MKKQFSIGEAVSYGWDTFKKNAWLFITLAAIDLIVGSIPNMISRESSPEKSWAGLIIWLISTAIQIGIITIALKTVDSKKTGFSDLSENFSCYWRYLGATILYGFIVLVGFILLIVPGVIWAIKYQFYGYLIVDKKMGAMEALKKSGEITKGVRLDLFLLGLVLLGVIILGALVLGVGLLAAVPTVWLAMAYVYRKLSKAGGGSKEIAEEAPAA
jgi:uncharacterized membrane protein